MEGRWGEVQEEGVKECRKGRGMIRSSSSSSLESRVKKAKIRKNARNLVIFLEHWEGSTLQALQAYRQTILLEFGCQ